MQRKPSQLSGHAKIHGLRNVELY